MSSGTHGTIRSQVVPGQVGGDTQVKVPDGLTWADVMRPARASHSRWLAGSGSSAGRLRPGHGQALTSAGGGWVVVGWGRFSGAGAEGLTRRMRAAGAGSHQFQR